MPTLINMNDGGAMPIIKSGILNHKLTVKRRQPILLVMVPIVSNKRKNDIDHLQVARNALYKRKKRQV
jgi:hypothetical protein